MTKRRIARRVMPVRLAMAVARGAIADVPLDAEALCGADAVVAGTTCLDRYEASVWRVPDPTGANAGLVAKIRRGEATAADLAEGAATRLGVGGDDYAPCADNGQSCADDLFAVSLPSVVPSGFATWFQAQEACASSGKRLPTSAEWQVGANGSPDPGADDGATDCNSARGAASPTGARSRCVSARGAADMVGNLAEWVADWVPLSTACPGWDRFSDDEMCLAGASTTESGPGALVRGGGFTGGASAGPLSVVGTLAPSGSEDFVGFRCVRNLPEPGHLVLRGSGVVALAALVRVRARSLRRTGSAGLPFPLRSGAAQEV